MNYLLALKTAREHFGRDALAVTNGDTPYLFDLIQEAENAPTVEGSTNIEVRIRTDAEFTTTRGVRVPAWAIYDRLPSGEPNGEDEEGEPLLRIIANDDLYR